MDRPGHSAVKFHLSLNVADLSRSIAFYRVLFGLEPAKAHHDYAKFELEQPPVIFSLVPRSPGSGGPLGRVGLRVSSAALQEYRQRLEAAGIACLAVPTGPADMLRVRDPDGTTWRIDAGDDDEAPEVYPDSDAAPARSAPESSWEHFVTESDPGRIPHPDGSLDEVRLTGTFNSKLDERARGFLVQEARRVLRPGGRVLVHGLLADAPLSGPLPTLPGLAALVARVPVQTEPADLLQQAGFAGVQIIKHAEKAWFVHGGAGLREVKILARQPYTPSEQTRQVTYRGPFREVVGDDGRVYERGRKVTVPLQVWQQLQESPVGRQFKSDD